MSADGFEAVIDSANEYVQAMQDLQAHLKQGWLSISKARYSMDPTALSRAAMSATDTEGLHARMDEGGFFFADLKQENRETSGIACHVPEVKTDFEAALQKALTAINARHNLTEILSQAAPRC